MFDVKCFHETIRLCIGRSKLAGEHAGRALYIYGRYIIGDLRLATEALTNSHSAPQAAREFVLVVEEMRRQKTTAL